MRLVSCTVLLALSLSGCATATDPRDPLEPVNRGIYRFNETVDKAVLKPVAQGYKAVLPQPVRTGVANFFSNIEDVLIALNNLLQFKFHNAASDVARVAFNTTFGIAGIFDVATSFGLEKHDEDFGQTLGYWGIGDGPFLMLPILGPSNLRDTVGLAAYYQLDPVLNLDHIPTRNTLSTLRFVNHRAQLLDAEKVLDEAALDPYTFLRDAYIQHRRSLIYDGNPPREKLLDDEDPPPQPAPRSEAPAAWEAAAPAAPAEQESLAVTNDLSGRQE
ncbi:MlaA family lipoprotein [Thiobacter aerophilum]|uniref:VacJ family lipoprotein n=1 Tax=Thiobacter aerophilum TaxID=3121275 RepID=A0ABV0EB87_9BURK